MVPVETRNLLTKVNGRVQYAQEIVDAFDKVFAEAADTTAENGLAKQKATSDNTQLSIAYTEDSKPVAIVNSDILSNIDTGSWDNNKKKQAKSAAKTALLSFKNGVKVNGITYKVNRTSRREYTRSKDTEIKYYNATDIFADKMRSAANAGDIITATTSWENDAALKHQRDDSFVDFVHGDVLIQSGKNQYIADTIVGITIDGNYVFYDVVDMEPTKFKIKEEPSQTTAVGTNTASDIREDSSDNTIPQSDAESQEEFSPTGGQLMLSDAIDTQIETWYDYTKPFAEQVDDYAAGKIKTGDTLIISGTPEVFKSVGFNSLPMTIGTRHIDYALRGTKDADHFWGEESLKELPELLKKPVAIFASETQPDTSVVALLSKEVNGKQAIAPVIIDGFGVQNGIKIDSNAVASVFGKGNSVDKLLYEAIVNEGKGAFSLLYWNKKEAISLLNDRRLQLPAHIKIDDGFIHSILEEGSPVKRKFAGQTETKQFESWFGNSKAVNKDGSPRILYHWTSEDFTVFDLERSGNNQGNTHGDGIYLSSDPNEFSYAGTTRMDLYAAIKKPFEMNLSKKQAQQIYDRYFRPHHEDRFGTYEPHVVDALQSRTKVFDYLSEAASTNNTKTSEILKELGYDGVHDGAEWVAFDRNQVKSATDNMGTFDASSPDIRFQLADYIDEYGEIEPGENPAREVHLPKKTGKRQILTIWSSIKEAGNKDTQKTVSRHATVRRCAKY